MSFRQFILMSLFLGVFCNCFGQGQNVAVLAFSGDKNTTKEQLQSLTQQLETELVQGGVFQVLERSQIDLILQEQGFQQTGACDATNCQVEVGKLLSVESIITGSVVLFEDMYILNTKRVDVESGSVIHSGSVKIKGTLNDVLMQGCPIAAKQLTAQHLKVEFAKDTTFVGTEGEQRQAAATQAAQEVQKEKKKSKALGAVERILQLGCLGVMAYGGFYGFQHNEKSDDAYDDYSKLGGDTDLAQERMDEAWGKVDDEEKKRNRYYGIAALGAVGLISVSIAF